MQHGFVRVATGSPALRVADCAYNAAQIVQMMKEAHSRQVHILVLPQLGVTGNTCGDLLGQATLLNGARQAIEHICAQTKELNMITLLGAPLRQHGKLYNCAVVLQAGRVLGIVPKTHLANDTWLCEGRHFAPAGEGVTAWEGNGPLAGVPFGRRLLFGCSTLPQLVLGCELGEDLWAPCPPSVAHALAGATVIANLSADEEGVGKAAYRRRLVAGQSARLACAYLYANAGEGESTSDQVFSGHNMAAENGMLLAESKPFAAGLCFTEVDVQRLAFERQRRAAFPAENNEGYQLVSFQLPRQNTLLSRPVARHPFVPDSSAELQQRCEHISHIQAQGLRKRLAHTAAKCAVVGVSGGLDSALALLVAAQACSDLPGCRPLAVTMPAFGTTTHTRNNAEKLCQALDVELLSIDLSNIVAQHLDTIGHSEAQQDVVYENAQARMRTLTLMDLANKHEGLVVGTGDLSELALGWATYGGDHLSMYGVNAGVPKTLVRHMVAHQARGNKALQEVLQEILNTPVSPELLPPQNGVISQQTEEIVGPYELHDFFLYHAVRWGQGPGKTLRLAKHAFAAAYSDAQLEGWLTSFYKRFFSQQFKRNCLPDGPKVGSVSLSPQGGWRMPSDAEMALWLEELE